MRRVVKAVAALCAMLALAPAIHAQQYPSRTIRFIVPFPPGGLADYVARVITQTLTQSLGQQLLVDNRPGADGALAGTLTMKAAPDGYTLFFATNSPLSAVPALHKNPPYDPIADFTPISLMGRFTFFLFVTPTLPVRTLSELIEYARANPGKLNYGTGNTSAIVATAQFKMLAGIDMTQIPYKGDAPTTTDMLGGRIQLAFMATVPGLTQAKEGRLRLLAVLLPQRSALAPDVPTIAEAGMPGISISPWGGAFGPAKLPGAIVERLSKEFNAALARPDVREKLSSQGFEPQSSTPAELGAYNKEQLQTWKRVIREAKITVE